MESFESEGSTFHFEAGGAGKDAGTAESSSQKRPAYRPPIGIPSKTGKDLGGKITAALVHLLFLLLLLAPLTSPELRQEILGAGGAGPAGGGGGGNRGSGGGSHKTERTQFVQVAPPPPPPKPTLVPQVKPPEVVKPPEIKQPPITQPPVDPKPETKAEIKNDLAASATASVTAGVGGGSGTDGSAGSGSGSGGGVGSGVGTGRGSGVGAGTGGGSGTIYPPTPTELFIPPMPPPSKIKGFELIAKFEVDSTGKVLSFDFNHTKDSGYNQKLESILRSVRFRPGVNGLGVPVTARTQIVYTF